MPRPALCIPVAAAVCALACASTQPRIVERIAGAERVRNFASATAYEAFLRSELALAHGEPSQAARQLELAVIADPSDGYLAARRAEVLLLAGDPVGALEAAHEATHHFADSAAAWLALGEVLNARGDSAGAAVALTHALSLAPDDPEVRAATARTQGASPGVVGVAMETAPDALPGDRTAGRRMALDPNQDHRPTLRSVRRALAQQAWERGAYRDVDLLLTPLVESDPADVIDRVRVIEARALDGRQTDAARLMPGVPIGVGTAGVSAAERARLWALAGHAEIAAEEGERAFAADPNDVLARFVLGSALVDAGSAARGIAVLAGVPVASPWFIEARIQAARGLDREGRIEEADLSLAGAILMLTHDDAVGRDRFRLARATMMLSRGATGEAREVLASIESASGRQRRGAMLANTTAPAAVLADLRARSGDAYDDGVSDAWIALLCFQQPAACSNGEGERALVSARNHATSAPETFRALALATSDRRNALELLRQAAIRDPLSAWNVALSRQLGFRGPGNGSP